MKLVLTIILLAFFSFHGLSQKNGFQLGLGYGGSDGVNEEYIYELGYKNNIWKSVSISIAYRHISGDEVKGRFSNDELINSKFIGEQNKSPLPITNRSIDRTLFTGFEVKVAKTLKSYLYLICGSRYSKILTSKITSIGPESLQVSQYNENNFGLELGIGYQRQFSNKHFVGGKFIAGPSTASFGVILTTGVQF